MLAILWKRTNFITHLVCMCSHNCGCICKLKHIFSDLQIVLRHSPLDFNKTTLHFLVFLYSKHGEKNCRLTCFCSSSLSLSSSWRCSCSLSSCILFLSSLSSISICAQRGLKLSTEVYTSEVFRQAKHHSCSRVQFSPGHLMIL